MNKYEQNTFLQLTPLASEQIRQNTFLWLTPMTSEHISIFPRIRCIWRMVLAVICYRFHIWCGQCHVGSLHLPRTSFLVPISGWVDLSTSSLSGHSVRRLVLMLSDHVSPPSPVLGSSLQLPIILHSFVLTYLRAHLPACLHTCMLTYLRSYIPAWCNFSLTLVLTP